MAQTKGDSMKYKDNTPPWMHIVLICSVLLVSMWMVQKVVEKIQLADELRWGEEGHQAAFNREVGVVPPFIPSVGVRGEACSLDVECSKLAQALVWEARSEPTEGMVAVASVILNRRDHPKFPDTTTEVIEQPRQFSYLQDMKHQRKPTQQDWDRAFLVAFNVKNGVVDRVEDVLFYLNKDALKTLPRWARVYSEVGSVGRHTFYTY